MKMKATIYVTVFILFAGFFPDVNPAEKRKNQPTPDRPSVHSFSNITITSIYDNYKVNKNLKTAWGFASLIQSPEETILFDTGGNAKNLLYNMKRLGIQPESIDQVFISHAHRDHVGGLEGFLEKFHNVKVYAPASFDQTFKQMIIEKGAALHEVSSSEKICDFAFSTGEMTGPPTEQSIILNSPRGIIVMTGCAHPGIVKIVKKAKEIMQKEYVYLVVGGFHRPPDKVVEEFRKLRVQKVAPSHCTGNKIRKAFKEEYKKDYIEYGVGKSISIKSE